jgi:hypothetical protein
VFIKSIFGRFGLGRDSHMVLMGILGILLTGAEYANGGDASTQLRIGALGPKADNSSETWANCVVEIASSANTVTDSASRRAEL